MDRPSVIRFHRVRVLLRWLAVIAIVALLGLTWGLRWFDENVLADLPEDLSSYREWRPLTVCEVHAADGTPVDTFYLERRFWVPLDELPPHAWQAFIAAEDRRFFDHPGVDARGIGRALLENWRAGGVRQGGSTITQQLVKNLLVGKERTYVRKMKEVVLAVRLEQELTKQEILELFVNYVYLGGGNYGIEAAAQGFFGVSARQLDPGQAALLAGMVPAPSRYNPHRSPEVAAARRKIVLLAMAEEGYLTDEAVESYLDDPVTRPHEPQAAHGEDLSYVTLVRRELRRVLPSTFPFERGLSVHTALDRNLQAVAEEAVRKALFALDERQGRRGAVEHLAEDEWEGWLARGPGLPRDPDSGAWAAPQPGSCFDALVGKQRDLAALEAGDRTFEMAPETRDVRVRSGNAGPAPLRSVVRKGDVLRVCLREDGNVDLDPRPFAEGAAVVVENATGRILAVVGGYEVPLEGFVRAAQARRQPGSSFKPYVYAAALDEGASQVDLVEDSPLTLSGAGGASWSPQNFGGGFSGTMPMRRALAASINLPAIRTGLKVGMDHVAAIAKSMGVQTPLRTDPTVAIGSSEVTPMDMALGYATIARMGVPVEPVFVDRIVDREGGTTSYGQALMVDGKEIARLPGGERPRALASGTAYELLDMMRAVVKSGTARRAYDPKLDRAGKTGTTNDYVDAWFVGMTPRHTIAVWIGTDGTTPLGDRETGSRAALPAWMEIAEALGRAEGERFPIPDDAMLVPFEGEWIGVRRGNVRPTLLETPKIAANQPLPAFAEPRR